MGRKIEVEIVGDSASLSKAFNKSAQAAGVFSGRMSGASRGLRVAGIAAASFGAALTGGVVAVLKVGIGEFSEHAKVAAQTGAVLKATGGVANVTARHVDKLSGSLMRQTGIDDELIASGQNLLLTFKNVRNEVGAGNAVFDRATKAALDLSVAGFGSMESTSKIMGKALNDPIKGMSALGRAGVTFSEDQKKAIAALVKTGDLLGAQKILLREVESQVGGSAAAYGKTLPGQLALLKQSFSNLAGEVVTSLVPSFARALEWTTAHWPQIEAVFKAVFTGIGTAIGALVGFFQTHWATITTVTTTAFNAIAAVAAVVWPQVRAAAETVMAWYQGTLRPTIIAAVEAIRAFWDKFGADILNITRTTFSAVIAVVRPAIQVLKSIIELGMALIRGDWSAAWNAVKSIVTNAIAGVVAVIRGSVSVIGALAAAIGRAIALGVLKLGALAGQLFEKLITAVGTAISNAAAMAYHLAFSIGAFIGRGIIAGAKSMARSVAGAVKDVALAGPRAAMGALGIHSPSTFMRDHVGIPMGQGLILGWQDSMKSFPGNMIATIRTALQTTQTATIPNWHQVGRMMGQTLGDGAINSLSTLQARLASGLTAALDSAWQVAWNSLSAKASALGAVNTGGISVNIPGFAKGVKNYRGGLAVVGEQGPELVRLPRGSDVIPAGGSAMRTGGGGDVHFNFPNYVGDKRELVDMLRTELSRTSRRNGGTVLPGFAT